MNRKIDKLRRFQEVICFLTAKSIYESYSNSFGSLMDYDLADDFSKAYHLGICPKLLQDLARCCVKKFVEQSSHLFTYHKHFHNAQNGINKNAWFELNRDVLKKWLSDKDNLNIKKCTLICEDSKKFLEEKAFAPLKREKNMTKAREREIRRECAEGKHGCSAEYLIKEEKKAERRAEKAAQRRMDKSNAALVEALTRIKQLTQENAELRAELKAQAEREVPDDSLRYENSTLCYEIDEQDKQLVEACEAELARDIFLDRHSSDYALADDKEALVDECIEILRRKHEANVSAPYKSASSIDDPTLIKRITHVKNVLQQAFDRSYVSFEEAKLYLRAKFGIKLELDKPHAIDWNKYQTLESVDWRRKLFKDADEAIARGEWKDASAEDIAKVRERHETLEEQFRRLKTA